MRTTKLVATILSCMLEGIFCKSPVELWPHAPLSWCKTFLSLPWQGMTTKFWSLIILCSSVSTDETFHVFKICSFVFAKLSSLVQISVLNFIQCLRICAKVTKIGFGPKLGFWLFLDPKWVLLNLDLSMCLWKSVLKILLSKQFNWDDVYQIKIE